MMPLEEQITEALVLAENPAPETPEHRAAWLLVSRLQEEQAGRGSPLDGSAAAGAVAAAVNAQDMARARELVRRFSPHVSPALAQHLSTLAGV